MERLERKDPRLAGFDYSTPGGYFITICAKARRHLFWSSERDAGPDAPASDGHVGASFARPVLSRYGKIVSEELQRLAQTYPTVALDKSVIMPNHIHMILILKPQPTGRAKLAPTIPRILQQFKGAVTKHCGVPVWQKGYHDHIIRNDDDYRRIWQYIDTNPAKWREDRYYEDGAD